MAFQLRRAIRAKDLSASVAALDEIGADYDLDALVNGCTPLSFATYADFPEGVELLVTHGAKPEVQSYIMDLYHWKGTEAPLHTVARKIGRNNLKIAQCLISHGASPAATDSFGVTPLRYAVHNRDCAMIELLLRNGADPFQQIRDCVIRKVIQDYRKDDGAAFECIWRWTVDHCATHRHVDGDGNTALHLAAKMGVTPAAEAMLETCVCGSGFFPHALNKNHESPLAVAVSAQNLETVYTLLRLSGRPPEVEVSKSGVSRSSLTAFCSPLYRAFKVTLDDGRYDETGHRCDAEFHEAQRKHRQGLFRRLCDVISDSGYPLRNENWLNYDFEDLLRGADGPVEFRDVSWDSIPSEMIDAARQTFESLRQRRRRPMSLKSSARLAIRTAIIDASCASCRGTKASLNERGAFEHLTKMLGLPGQLSDYIMFLRF